MWILREISQILINRTKMENKDLGANRTCVIIEEKKEEGKEGEREVSYINRVLKFS